MRRTASERIQMKGYQSIKRLENGCRPLFGPRRQHTKHRRPWDTEDSDLLTPEDFYKGWCFGLHVHVSFRTHRTISHTLSFWRQRSPRPKKPCGLLPRVRLDHPVCFRRKRQVGWIFSVWCIGLITAEDRIENLFYSNLFADHLRRMIQYHASSKSLCGLGAYAHARAPNDVAMDIDR